MVTETDFEAAISRITAAQGSTRVQLVAIRDTIIALRAQVEAGGVISVESLTAILEQVNAKADESETIDAEAQAADD